MAAAASGRYQEKRKLDGNCEYTAFNTRVDGKVACLGLGPTTPEDIENDPLRSAISGICFQKVNRGIVKAAIPVSDFVQVNWADAPTKPPPTNPPGRQNAVRMLNDEYLLGRVGNVENTWLEFTNAVSCVKAAMLDRMTPVGGQQPGCLLDGFEEGFWRGAEENRIRYVHHYQSMLRHIKQDIGGTLNWDVNINNWIGSLLNGFKQNTGQRFRDLLLYLLPRCQSADQNVITPTDTSPNGGLADGSVCCLVYGYNDEQWVNARGRARNRRLEHRFLLRRRDGERSRSRSCSSSDDDDGDEEEDDPELEKNIQDRRNLRRRVIRNHDLFNEPQEYILKARKLHMYFESHKPDVLVWKCELVQDACRPGNLKEEITAKIVVEIGSSKKHEYGLTKHVAKHVEQCVQSCLAAFAVRQVLMYGLIVVVDGFVLVKVEKVQNEIKVSETDLITWDNTQSMHSILEELQNIL